MTQLLLILLLGLLIFVFYCMFDLSSRLSKYEEKWLENNKDKKDATD
ncbi:MAG: hypothetical protein AB7V16_07170 [Vulcanibacillus sp.]